MRKIRSALRQQALGQSVREIAAALRVSPTTAGEYLRRARRAGLSWPLPEGLDDSELERRLYSSGDEPLRERPLPDWTAVHTELRKKHVTLMLLWQEHKAEHPDGHEYSQFCELYRHWSGHISVWMRQQHRGGEKLFVDYSGDGIAWFDPATAQHHVAQLFVAAQGASSATFACATATQRLPDWLSAHVTALEFFGGVPAVLVPDQMRTAVSTCCRYDPELNPACGELAAHSGTCVFPARPRHPKDQG
jgi:transposase